MSEKDESVPDPSDAIRARLTKIARIATRGAALPSDSKVIAALRLIEGMEVTSQYAAGRRVTGA